MKAALAFACLIFGAAGCGGVISEAVRVDSVPILSFRDLRENPEPYRGKTVILGGELIETRNRPEGTTLLVLQRPLDSREKPALGDATGGRFKVRLSEYLDPVLFARGRKITVAGTVEGVETEKVGEAPYRYVLLESRELHLWPDGEAVMHPYPYDPWYPWWYEPRWGHRPWW